MSDTAYLRSLEERGVLFVADVRNKPKDEGVCLLYPFSEMRWRRTPFQADVLVWSRFPQHYQLEAMSKSLLADETKTSFMLYDAALIPVLSAHWNEEQQERQNEIYQNARESTQSINRFIQTISLGTVSDKEIKMIEEAQSFTQTICPAFKYVEIEGHGKQKAAAMTDGLEPTELARKLRITLSCWRYVLGPLSRGNEEVAAIAEAFDPASGENEMLGVIEDVGHVMGVDMMLKSIFEDGVPLEHVVDMEEMMRKIREKIPGI